MAAGGVLMGASLLEGEEGPAIVVNGGGRSPYVLICEHASNLLPKSLGTLGLPEAKLARIREIYRPFHASVADLLDARAVDGVPSMVITIHSFTPIYNGKARSVELGVLHDRDTTLSSKLIKGFPNVDARLNEPY